ncbi:ATP-dependent Clp protease ATP-binding subunit [Patescibacteria group bacterium AH-259-L07]|nr:ATP-dependent Clp protease ATP-binding subunit [Patescibacteria group bacterium AH-259-L07]
MDFIICPTCNGIGFISGKRCRECGDHGMYSWFGGYLLYVDRPRTRSEMATYKGGRVVEVILIIILALFGIVGLLSLLGIAGIVLGAGLIPLFITNGFGLWNYISVSQSTLVLFFWLSIIGDLYVIYAVEYKRDRQKKNWPKSTKKTAYEWNSWEKIRTVSKRTKIDISDAFSRETINIIFESQKFAQKVKSEYIEPIHIFAALLEDSDITLAINRLGIDWKILKNKIIRFLAQASQPKTTRQILYSLEAKKVLLRAYTLAGTKRRTALSPLDLLEAITTFEGPVKEIFYDLEIEPLQIENVCLWIDVYDQLRQERRHFARQARFKPKGPINRTYTAIATPYLDRHSHDMTQLARGGYLGICMDREKEIDEIFRIITGGSQSIILVGQPGVGKTTIINGISRRMVTEDVPEVLQDKRLVSLSLSSLIAGASRPGEVEQRLQVILSEVIRSGNIILVIKDIHNMVGIKTTEGELDVSEILADILKRHAVLVLATSIPSEYRRLIEGKALGEAFQRVGIEEPDKNTTIQILEAHTPALEGRNQVYFSYGALDKAVEFSTRYLHERFLPEKAINLLKEVAAGVRSKKGKRAMVGAEDVAALISEKTGIPVTKITEKESQKLLNLEDQIHRRLVDQDEAVNMVSAALRRARTALRSEKRPIVNLLFLGPTGVGKTELAKTVAEVYFGDENKMIRLDMSEYQEKASVSRLIGTPDGEKGGQLTEAVRRAPSSLLLLDEIEKAHPDILNIFLQVMDEGRLTDALGRTINFTNIILIGTSNAGTAFIQSEIKKGTPVLQIQEALIREKLSAYFRPEYLNRFDGIVVFKPLSPEDIQKITKLMLKKLSKQLEGKGIGLKATDEAVNELAKAGFDPLFGARPLRRVIQNQVNNVLAKYLLTGKVARRDVVILEKGGTIRVEKAEQI